MNSICIILRNLKIGEQSNKVTIKMVGEKSTENLDITLKLKSILPSE